MLADANQTNYVLQGWPAIKQYEQIITALRTIISSLPIIALLNRYMDK
ncbi:hypothetical protein HK44_020770 [Pseudomonas fluorescens HK44]|uniref:Uncharacterized protein n=1 Tax=Pseudomonas fluorescens HK44 TaxID=1042209 RepID=A0A010S777_PSEFL|nr:hypothetical protein HK44_020770 [Pseudomonas fluorescens HK44]